MDWDSVDDLASGKWHPSLWGEDVKMTTLQKKILLTARELRRLIAQEWLPIYEKWVREEPTNKGYQQLLSECKETLAE